MNKSKLSMAIDDMHSMTDTSLLEQIIIDKNDFSEYGVASTAQTIDPKEIPDFKTLLSQLMELQELYEKQLFESIFNVSYDDFKNNNLSASQMYFIEKAIEYRGIEKFQEYKIDHSPYMPYIIDVMTRQHINKVFINPIKIVISNPLV